MIALFLLLVIVAIALGIVGVVAKGLLYLLFIGIVVFVGAKVKGRAVEGGTVRADQAGQTGRGLSIGQLEASRAPADCAEGTPAASPCNRRETRSLRGYGECLSDLASNRSSWRCRPEVV